VQVLYVLGLLDRISEAMSPLTVWWLGLPSSAGTLLMLGVIRKELILLVLVAIYGSTNLLLFLDPVQLLVLALIGMLYIPCVSTIAILAKEFGSKTAIAICVANILSAILAGGIAFRLLTLIF